MSGPLGPDRFIITAWSSDASCSQMPLSQGRTVYLLSQLFCTSSVSQFVGYFSINIPLGLSNLSALAYLPFQIATYLFQITTYLLITRLYKPTYTLLKLLLRPTSFNQLGPLSLLAQSFTFSNRCVYLFLYNRYLHFRMAIYLSQTATYLFRIAIAFAKALLVFSNRYLAQLRPFLQVSYLPHSASEPKRTDLLIGDLIFAEDYCFWCAIT